MITKSQKKNDNLIPAIQQLMMELVKQNILGGQRMDALGQRMDALGYRMDVLGQRMDTRDQRMEATLERQEKKFEEMRTVLLTVIDRLRSVEQTLARLPDAIKEKIGFQPVTNP